MNIGLSLPLQIVACAVTIVATWLTGNKSVAGPALNIAAALCFATVNAYADLWLCAAFSVGMAAMNTRNYLRWRGEKA